MRIPTAVEGRTASGILSPTKISQPGTAMPNWASRVDGGTVYHPFFKLFLFLHQQANYAQYTSGLRVCM